MRYTTRLVFSAPIGALRLSARLLPNRLSYPESVTLSRIGYLTLNRQLHQAMVSLSAQRSISDSPHHNQNILTTSTVGIPCPAEQLPHFRNRRNKFMAVSLFDLYFFRIVESYGQSHHPDNLFVDHPGASVRCTPHRHASARMRTNRSESFRLF